MKTRLCFLIAVSLAVKAQAQSVLFDFENATVHSPLPVTLTVGAVTAQFTATGQGFSIQPANTMGFTPVGFAGNCIYPSSVYAADLLISFSTPLTEASILYAPQELACDASATMRITAYLDAALVGTATTNAQAGTWPSEILGFRSSQKFNRIVVHYDQGPAGGGDWGPIFMADNLTVTPAPLPIVLSRSQKLPDGTFQLSFTNIPGYTFTVLGSTNATLPFANWTVLGAATEISPGQFQFTDSWAASTPRCFYRVRQP